MRPLIIAIAALATLANAAVADPKPSGAKRQGNEPASRQSTQPQKRDSNIHCIQAPCPQARPKRVIYCVKAPCPQPQ